MKFIAAALTVHATIDLPFTPEDWTNAHESCQPTYPSLDTYRPLQQGYELVSVQLVTRHGDRAPANALPSHDTWDCRESVVLGETIFEVTPKTGQNSYCKGTNPLPRDICKRGQLTSKGQRQMETLGIRLSQVYQGFVTSKDDLTIRSTDSDRCIESAMALARGFLPNEPTIEITTLPMEKDNMVYYGHVCPKQARLTKELGQSHKVHAPQLWFAHLHPEIPIPTIAGPEYAIHIMTDLPRCRYCHGKPPATTHQWIMSLLL
ncbi:hypothetical protein DSO57_1016251 [Entomophthora muscae]|uniref:Uncharacterized protein n=1 Tax=Entomophthora muscae TaxID=34485 RepID=A0ACC2RW62_9FUNG|nr:hypothetical protein DSO57_1016251 [Entomophthora muscae]